MGHKATSCNPAAPPPGRVALSGPWRRTSPPARRSGRDRELAEVDAFLDAAGDGLRALALTGHAGIGKTTVWREGVSRAECRGLKVLRAQPVEPERALSFAGLADLLSDLPDRYFAALPTVQKKALDAALLRIDTSAAGEDQRAAPAAVLSVLRRLAEDGPLLLAVDDAQWLDQATADALSFAIRRLPGSGIAVLTSVRSGGDLRPQTFDLALPVDRRRDVWLGPLSVAVLRELVRTQLREPAAEVDAGPHRGGVEREPFLCHGDRTRAGPRRRSRTR